MGIVSKKRATKVLLKSLREYLASLKKLIIFDKYNVKDNRVKKNSESYYSFYNRCDWPEVKFVREFIESSAKNYPKSEIPELISRLKSGDDIHFNSVVFELALHEILFQQGFELTAHPDLNNGSASKPDFLVKDVLGNEFYLEAVLASENSMLEGKSDKSKGVVFDKLSSSPHENFRIDIREHGHPNCAPSGKKLLRELNDWLDTLDPDEISEKITLNGFDSIEPFNWDWEGWYLSIRPIPIPLERRGKSTELIGVGSMKGGSIDALNPIRKAVKFKGGKYGDLDKPLVVAINMNSMVLKRIDEEQALFGSEKMVYEIGTGKLRVERNLDGAWCGRNGPKSRRVSGAWIFDNFNIISLSSRVSTLYLNPWANISAPESLKKYSHSYVEGEIIIHENGLTINEALSI
jgi:hypothetical protein